ncbi:MAG: hypothetical protein IPP08_05430 [Chlorobiota bacterium]|nr:hypothetical protein [Chlorobiota bacterium]QQS67607.1 MAG: hypothetical protein IPP08_05430 [Chlorobiota bacterium]
MKNNKEYDSVINEYNIEFDSCKKSFLENKIAKSRVCARRAIGILVRRKAELDDGFYGVNSLENLNYFSNKKFPIDVNEAASRLQGGERSKIQGELFSDKPLDDLLILTSFLFNN